MATQTQHSPALSIAIAVALGLISPQVLAQQQDSEQKKKSAGLSIAAPVLEQVASGPIEEVVTIGRSLNSTQMLIGERIDDEVVVDVLGAEAISRLGDSNVATALRRVPGLSLVQNKFVYIRGLGERYSASMLNGAFIPSPDLTRNVIPLDIFPTAIVESLRVQKAFSADMPANFGGGSVDIRTKGIPDQFTYLIEVGSGLNDQNSGTALTYAGGSDDDFGVDDGSRTLSPVLLEQINRFAGNTSVQGILNTLRAEGQADATVADAQLINRQLGTELNRNIGIEEADIHPDISVRGSVGNNFILGRDWEAGFLVGANYDTNWRNTIAVSRNFRFPTERTDTERESTRSVNMSGNMNLGVRFTDDHELATTTLYLRNTDDETAVRDFFNANREVSDGIGFRGYRFQFEERDMITNQLTGTHRLGQTTRSWLPQGIVSAIEWLPTETEVHWFWSDSRASTDIPSQVDIAAQTTTDPATGATLASAVGLDATAADYRFTDLSDDVLNHGWNLTIPFEGDRSVADVSVGYQHNRKARVFRQSQFSLGALSVADPSQLDGELDDVFSDANILDPRNDYVFNIQGTNNQSYIAATMVDALYGKVDITFNDTWRIAAGARWEDYRQVALDWNPFGFSAANPVLSTDPDKLQSGTFQDDRIYPALAVTYMGDWLAETFQLRLNLSQTTVRPDLREITDASYVDPITDDLVDGNPGVIPSDVTNADLRAEWFFSGGDSFTATLFYKNINNPIEFFESAASDTTTAREIINADSAQVMGVEIEGLKKLDFLGGSLGQFFLQGNVTVQDSELVAGPDADAPTNPIRKLTGASDLSANMTLGFDSDNGEHSAALGYNVFGERLYVAGRNGAPDGFEQPFHSVDLTYSWYPTDYITVKAKARNLLDEAVSIEREGVLTFEEKIGQSFSLNFQWAL
ncbi:MAG: TonB-dependent receptor [Gammaproteobacteria bacterium]